MPWEKVLNNCHVHLKAGKYFVKSPICFNGISNVVLSSDGDVTLTGSRPLHVNWRHEDGDIYSTYVQCDIQPDILKVGNDNFIMARYPHYVGGNRIYGGYHRDCLEFAARCRHPEDGYLHTLHSHLWGDMHYRIIGVKGGQAVLEGGWQNNRPMGTHAEYRFVENLYEALGQHGEFFYDKRTQILYVCANSMPNGNIELVINPYVFDIRNCDGIVLENLRIENTSRTFMAQYEPLLRSDWCVHRGGAIFVEDSSGITIKHCEFNNIGSNAIFVSGGSHDNRIERCHFYDIGASCVLFVGKPSSINSPRFGYDAPNDDIDMESIGPANNEYVRDCTVDNCLMHDFGFIEKQTSAVCISMAARISVLNSSIYTCPRAAINICENSFGGHVIEGNDVFDTVRETGDHGAFNSWGRDRYWGLNELSSDMRYQLALKDACEPVIIRNNRFRCDHGWDIDLDDGSSHYIIEGNLCLNGGIKLREGYARICRNNIIINNGIHLHVWFNNSRDVIERNIMMMPYMPIGMGDNWDGHFDQNILHVKGMENPMHAVILSDLSGSDDNSIMIDVMFKDSAHGDFTVTNPFCNEIGFDSFEHVYGVKDLSLRDKAKQCPIPNEARGYLPTEPRIVKVNGVTLKSIDTDGEVSAFQTAGRVGAIIVDISFSHKWYDEGMRAGQAIIAVDGKQLASADEFKEIIDNNKNKTVLSLTTKGSSGDSREIHITLRRRKK
jgi:hypothetical protein